MCPRQRISQNLTFSPDLDYFKKIWIIKKNPFLNMSVLVVLECKSGLSKLVYDVFRVFWDFSNRNWCYQFFQKKIMNTSCIFSWFSRVIHPKKKKIAKVEFWQKFNFKLVIYVLIYPVIVLYALGTTWNVFYNILKFDQIFWFFRYFSL